MYKFNFSRLTINTTLFHYKDQSVVIFGATIIISCPNPTEN